jgi:hypothetical protein
MKIKISVILLLFCSQLFSQNDIKLRILNDTIYFNPTKDEYFDPLIDCTLYLELENVSCNNYVLYFDSSKIVPYYFFKDEINDRQLRYDHNPCIQTLLYDADFNRVNTSGGVVSFDDEYSLEILNKMNLEDSIIFEEYKFLKPQMDSFRFLENYKYNQHKFYIKPNEIKRINVKMNIPYFDINYLNTYNLSNSLDYYLEFFFHNKKKSIKSILSKSEKKYLKTNNIKIFNGTLYASRKVPLLFREPSRK